MIEIGISVPPSITHIDQAIAAVIPDIVEHVRGRLVALAHERLHSSAEDYIAGIQPPKLHIKQGTLPESGSVATIALVGWLPNAIESGWAGGDMKEALLTGRNARIGKDGSRYNTVPFRHGTPGSRGTNFPPMGSAYARGGRMPASDAAKLGKRVYARARKLEGSTSEPGGSTQWGGRLPAGLAPKLRSHHVTDIYAGMVRFQKLYSKATQSKYMTFRRVSDNSKPESWIHPGIEAAHLFDAVAAEIPDIASHLFAQAIKPQP